MSRYGHKIPADLSEVVTVKNETPQSSWSWISIDKTGQKTVLDLDKHEIMHRVQIEARDLRILDPNLFYPSAILGRERAIVLNLEHIKMIITANEVLLRDSSDENVIPVLEELQRRLPVGNVIHHDQGDGEASGEDEFPFEFRGLEVALEAICLFLDARRAELQMDAYHTLDKLTSEVSSRILERFPKLKSSMTRLTERVQKIRDELEQLLDDDGDMADLYLSRKLAEQPNWYPTSPTIRSRGFFRMAGDENYVEELEMLLEAYFMQIDGTLNSLNVVHQYIDDTEDYINIVLNNQGNQLSQVDLIFRALHVSITMYSMIVGMFSMNIPFTLNNNHGYIFKLVVSLTGTFCAALFVIIVSYFRSKGIFIY